MKSLKIFFKKTFYFLLRNLVSIFQNTNERRIIFIQESFSGSNTYAIYKLMSDNFKLDNDVILYKDRETKGVLEYIKKFFPSKC